MKTQWRSGAVEEINLYEIQHTGRPTYIHNKVKSIGYYFKNVNKINTLCSLVSRPVLHTNHNTFLKFRYYITYNKVDLNVEFF